MEIHLVVRARKPGAAENDFSWEIELGQLIEPPEWLNGYYSIGIDKQVKAYFTDRGFRWSRQRTSIFVTSDVKAKSISAATTGRFGILLRLRPESVLPDIDVVCTDDVKTAIHNGNADGSFTDLQHMCDAEKRLALRKAADGAKDNQRGHYAEAVLNRGLKTEDFLTPFQDAIVR